MPINPKPGEQKSDFIGRCISTEIKAGKPQDQAAAICYRVWEDRSKVKKNDPVKQVAQFGGLPVSIEWKDGETRQWAGSPYRNPMVGTNYGFINETQDGDGEEVDVYLAEPAVPGSPVFMMSQLKKDDGSFDEHKFFLGFPTEEQARAAYAAAMPKEMMGEFAEMTMDDFKDKYLKFHWRDGMGKQEQAENNSVEKINKCIDSVIGNLQNIVKKCEAEELVEVYAEEIPAVCQKSKFAPPEEVLPPAGVQVFKSMYARARKDGLSKKRSMSLAWKDVQDNGYTGNSRVVILFRIAKALESLVEVRKAGLPEGTRRKRSDGSWYIKQQGQWKRDPNQKDEPSKETPEAAPAQAPASTETAGPAGEDQKIQEVRENLGSLMADDFDTVKDFADPSIVEDMHKGLATSQEVQDNAAENLEKILSTPGEERDQLLKDWSNEAMQMEALGITPDQAISEQGGKEVTTDQEREAQQLADEQTAGAKNEGQMSQADQDKALRTRYSRMVDNWDPEILHDEYEDIFGAGSAKGKSKMQMKMDVVDHQVDIRRKTRQTAETLAKRDEEAGTSQTKKIGEPFENKIPNSKVRNEFDEVMDRKPAEGEDISSVTIDMFSDNAKTFLSRLDQYDSGDAYENGIMQHGWASRFKGETPQWFILNRGGKKYLVDTEGYDYPRYMVEVEGL